MDIIIEDIDIIRDIGGDNMPVYEYQCLTCFHKFELMFIMALKPEEQCPRCRSWIIERIISIPHVRMDADVMTKSLPDPVPPLTELIGKNRPDTEGGYREIANDQKQLKEYKRKKDKLGNTEWTPIERTHIDMGRKK